MDIVYSHRLHTIYTTISASDNVGTKMNDPQVEYIGLKFELNKLEGLPHTLLLMVNNSSWHVESMH